MKTCVKNVGLESEMHSDCNKKNTNGKVPTTTITSSDAKKLFVVGRLVNALLLGPSFLDV